MAAAAAPFEAQRQALRRRVQCLPLGSHRRRELEARLAALTALQLEAAVSPPATVPEWPEEQGQPLKYFQK